MLPSASDRFLAELPDDARVLDVGGWAAPLNRADVVLDIMPYETRGGMGSYGPPPERFDASSWVIRDICDREPWPFADDAFDFAVCVTTLEDIRDPIWVCSELSRVAKAGYVEVPTIEAELIYNVEGNGQFLGHEHHRWLVEIRDGALEFMMKPHSLHDDWRLRVTPKMRSTMTIEDQLQGLFWEGSVPAREKVVIGAYQLDGLRERVRTRFPRPAAEVRAQELREQVAHRAAQAWLPVRGALLGVARSALARRGGGA